MLAKNCTQADLQKALDKVNEAFDNNIRFKRLDQQGKNIRFTLTVNDSRKAGGRIGHSGKRIAAACWHVHGQFFDNLLLNVNSNTVIVANGKQIYKQSYNAYVTGNWEDSNIGSQFRPLYYSEACNCKE